MQHFSITYKLLLVSILTAISCGTSQRITSTWVNNDNPTGRNYNKIFVAALVNDPHTRSHLEEEMGKNAILRGFQVERSLDHFPPSFRHSKPPAKEAMYDKIKELDCDLIFTINLIDKKSETRYIPGSMGIYGPYFGYGMHFRGFYTYWYPYIYDPGYYVTDKTYFMEGNFFEASNGKLLWSVQTETINPSSIEKFSRDLVKMIFEKGISDLQIPSTK